MVKATFGDQDGVNMATAYKESFDRQEDGIPKLFQGLPEREGEWVVEEMREPGIPPGFRCEQLLLAATKKGAKFYWVTFQMVFDGGTKAGSSAGIYTLVEGAYRRLDCAGIGLGLRGGVASGRPSHGPLRVGGNVQAARIINRVQPAYPQEAREEGISGTVRLHVVLATDGTVKQVELVSGHPLLAQAAIDAVRQWRYQPTLLNGEPVEVDTLVDLIFALGIPKTPNP
jgi:TonB family protein